MDTRNWNIRLSENTENAYNILAAKPGVKRSPGRNTGSEQNNGNTTKLRNIMFVGHIERTSIDNTEYSSVCLHPVALV
jgi:hypothetical protein